MTEGATGAPVRRRLSRGERFVLVFITLFAIGVGLLGLLHALAESITLFGEQATPRAHALAGQSLRIALWALLTPFCVWGLLRGGRRAVAAAFVWLGLLVATTPWAWPPRPITVLDTDKPLWLSASVLLWILAAAVVGTGIYSARRLGRASLMAIAIVVTLGVAGLGAASGARLTRRSNDERPKILPEGRTELAALRRDPLWSSFPPGIRRVDHEFSASRAPSGERLPTNKSVDLGVRPDYELFKRVVAFAEAAGWTFVRSNCYPHEWDATLDKATEVGNADLRISVASYLHGVSVVATIGPTIPFGKPAECWAA